MGDHFARRARTDAARAVRGLERSKHKTRFARV